MRALSKRQSFIYHILSGKNLLEIKHLVFLYSALIFAIIGVFIGSFICAFLGILRSLIGIKRDSGPTRQAQAEGPGLIEQNVRIPNPVMRSEVCRFGFHVLFNLLMFTLIAFDHISNYNLSAPNSLLLVVYVQFRD